MRVPLRPHENKLWGEIIISIVAEAKTTSHISMDVGKPIAQVRREIILMHHYGLIRPIGLKSTFGHQDKGGYYSDLLWNLTEHSMAHDDMWNDCRACNLRQLLTLSQIT